MKNNTQTLQERLRVAEEEIAFVRKQLEVPEPVVPVVPWEPSGGDFFLNARGVVVSKTSDILYEEAGVEFQTQQAAEKASEFYRFYHRIYKLSEECNARHPSTGQYYMIFRDLEQNIWKISRFMCPSSPLILFTSDPSAHEACAIMNRDGWVLPTI